MNASARFFPLLALAALSVLSGCASNPTCGADSRNFDSVTICPGASRTCATTPCAVYYVMPEGSGRYQVTGNQVLIGEFSVGETVHLGSFWDSQYFDIVGAEYPRAFVFMGDIR